VEESMSILPANKLISLKNILFRQKRNSHDGRGASRGPCACEVRERSLSYTNGFILDE